MDINIKPVEAVEIIVDGALWGFARRVAQWWGVYKIDSETGELEDIGTPDTLDELKKLVEENIAEEEELYHDNFHEF